MDTVSSFDSLVLDIQHDRTGHTFHGLTVFCFYSYFSNRTVDQDTSNADGYAGNDINGFYQEQAAWKTAANSKGCGYMPSITPGLNDRAVRLRIAPNGREAKALSRKISINAKEGSFMAQTVSRARPLLDPLADYLMMLTSFNEFHEDTQIEPVVVDKLVAAFVIANEGSQTAFDNLKVTDKALHIWNDARNGYLDIRTQKTLTQI